LGYFEFGNLFAAFIGVMGLKISAYLQPFLNKLSGKSNGQTDGSFDAVSFDGIAESDYEENKEVTM
jgi:hypothetical protein